MRKRMDDNDCRIKSSWILKTYSLGFDLDSISNVIPFIHYASTEQQFWPAPVVRGCVCAHKMHIEKRYAKFNIEMFPDNISNLIIMNFKLSINVHYAKWRVSEPLATHLKNRKEWNWKKISKCLNWLSTNDNQRVSRRHRRFSTAHAKKHSHPP